MSDTYKSYVSVVARILLALMFILSGFGKLMDIQGTAGYVASGGLPFPTLLAVGVGLPLAFEILGDAIAVHIVAVVKVVPNGVAGVCLYNGEPLIRLHGAFCGEGRA